MKYCELITLVIPIYNIENYLGRCLDSVINQTYKDLEIILVNDGSTDNSLEICESYAKEDSRIKIINKNNGGLSSARNVGLDACKGDYVTFIDSDDW
ncbi:glycosyl transferase, partial [Francisella tularensis subsp. holarctica]